MSEQAKVRKLSMGGQMLIGCDDDGEGLHLRVERSPAITSAARVFDILCPQTDYTIG